MQGVPDSVTRSASPLPLADERVYPPYKIATLVENETWKSLTAKVRP